MYGEVSCLEAGKRDVDVGLLAGFKLSLSSHSRRFTTVYCTVLLPRRFIVVEVFTATKAQKHLR